MSDEITHRASVLKSFLLNNKEKLYALIIISLVVCIANWKLLFLVASMKWDIIDAHLPLATFLGDSLRNGSPLLWNPMINYGFPQYSQIGDPLWYPTTIFFGLLGYTLLSAHLEYIIHVILAGFFMFLFIKDLLEGKKYRFFISLISGLVYAFSGLFISNAEHIMIIVSATLIPLEFLLLRKYIKTARVKTLLLLGFVTGFNIMGGYPAMFVFLFIVIFPYIFYEYFTINKNWKSTIKKSVMLYFSLGVLTMISSAISLIPFINANNYITRGEALSYSAAQFSSLSLLSLFTMFIPGISKYTYLYDSGDISMINMYISVLVLILLPVVFLKGLRKNIFYIALIVFTFIMLMGSYHILHPLFYQFVPTFDKFRFPSLWRAYFSFFVIILFAIEISGLFNNKRQEDWSSIKKVFRYCLSFLPISLLFLFTLYGIFYDKINAPLGKDFLNSLFIVFLVIFFYTLIFKIFYQKDELERKMIICLIGFLILELLTFHYYDFQILIANCDAVYARNLQNITAKRNKHLDFNNIHITSRYPLASNTEIICNRMLDAEGYNSFLLKEIPVFLNTYHRYLSVQKPVVYFTSKINYTSEEEVINRLNDLEFDIDSILVYRKDLSKKENFEFREPGVFAVYDMLPYLTFNNSIITISLKDITFNSIDYIPVLKLNFAADSDLILPVCVKYLDEAELLLNQYNSIFSLKKDFNSRYIYLPQNKKTGTVLVEFSCDISNLRLENCELLEVKKDELQNNIKINRFAPNEIDISVDVDEPGYLVIQQSFYPGWYAYDNGKPVDIEKVNYLFRGIKLDEGKHIVRFVFKPVDFYVGLTLTSIYLIVLIFFIVLGLFKKKKLPLM